MNPTEQCTPHFNALGGIDESFRLIGPLPIIGLNERFDYFAESEVAHDQYVAQRSINAPADTVTYHVVDGAGEVAGFISFRVAHEEGRGSTRIFFSIDYIYVMKKFRMRGFDKLLLEPVVRKVETELHEATGASRKPMVYLYSASQPESAGEERALRNLDEALLVLAKRRRGVELISRRVRHVAKAHRRTWEASHDTQLTTPGCNYAEP